MGCYPWLGPKHLATPDTKAISRFDEAEHDLNLERVQRKEEIDETSNSEWENGRRRTGLIGGEVELVQMSDAVQSKIGQVGANDGFFCSGRVPTFPFPGNHF